MLALLLGHLHKRIKTLIIWELNVHAANRVELSAYLSEYIGDLALHGGKCHDRQSLLVPVLQMQLELMNYNDPEDQIKINKLRITLET
jgi:hypothetical protein